MARQDRLLKGTVTDSAVCLLMCLAGSAAAAPVIQGVSGTFAHKGSVTITGSGFGTKAVAAPVVWDDASGTNILNKWSGAWPKTATTPSNNTNYRTPIRGISLPHNHITNYIAGCGIGGDAYSGNNVLIYKNRTISSYPAFTFFSWYQRSDDAWRFGGDNNYKVWDFSNGSEPYDLPNNWYVEYNPVPTSATSTAGAYHLNDDAYPNGLNGNIGSWWQGTAISPMSGVWTKIQMEIRYDQTSSGYIKLWENGVLKINYSGRTDGLSGNTRSEAIGGYQRMTDSNNWRYFADVYLDYTPARVVLANNSVLGQATIIEPQIPSAWTASSISVSVNLGKFASGQTAYLFVFDSTGTASAAGFPITVGGATTTLPAPSNLRVQ
jgi:hypothetical protein